MGEDVSHRMDLLYLPPSLRHFEPLKRPEAHTIDPAPLEYDLVEALRPTLCVDIGTGDAGAFFAFCQSARDHDVDGIFYAIDEWGDDTERGQTSLPTSASINNFLHTHFRGIAYLMRMPESDARQHFEKASVDLVRVDPTRVGQRLFDLMQAWVPMISPGGVLVVAGLSDGEANQADWNDFTASAGIVVQADRTTGVFRKAPSTGPQADEPDLLRLLLSGTNRDRIALGDFYTHAVRHHVLRREVRDVGAGLFRKKA